MKALEWSARVVTTVNIAFSEAQGQLTPKLAIESCLPKFKLVQAFIAVLITCQNEDDSYKYEGTRLVRHFSNCKSMGIFQTLKGS